MRKTVSLLLALATALPSLEAQPTPATPAAAEHLDRIFTSVRWRPVGPYRGGRSVTASGVVGNPTTY